MPTVQGTDDFNHAIDSGYYADGFFGSPSSQTSPLYSTTPRSLRIITDGNNQGVRHNISGSPTLGWAAFPYRTPSVVAGSGCAIHTFGTSGGKVGGVYLGTNELYTVCGAVTGTPIAIAADTWYWVETIFDITGTPTVYLRVEGVDAGSAAEAGSATAITWSQLIAFASDESGITSYYGGVWKWGSASSVSDWLGEPTGPTLDTVLPDADITTTGWTTAPLFSKINDASDATVIQATAA